MNRLHLASRASYHALAFACAALLSLPAVAAAEDLAIVGGTVHTGTGTTLEDANVVIRDGRITAIGKDAAIPAGARRIDATGKVVTPGLIDASTSLGLTEVNAVGATTEGRFAHGPEAVHAAYRVSDGYNPSSVAIPVTRAEGVTSAISAPRGGFVAGQAAWFRLGDGPVADRVVSDAVAMYAALGEGALDSAHGSRGVAVERLRELLDDAETYSRSRRAFERNQSRELAAERLDLEALIPVLRGQQPLVVRAHRASDIRAALGIARERGLRLIVEGGTEAWLLADELARAGVPVLLDPVENLPSSFDRVHVRDDAAAVLDRAGVDVILSTLGDAANVRTLRQRAGVAVAGGLPHAEALAAVTGNVARAFGVRGVGTLERGAVADVVVWSGDPFELATRPEAVIIAGEEQSLRHRQTLLLERYRRLPAR